MDATKKPKGIHVVVVERKGKHRKTKTFTVYGLTFNEVFANAERAFEPLKNLDSERAQEIAGTAREFEEQKR